MSKNNSPCNCVVERLFSNHLQLSYTMIKELNDEIYLSDPYKIINYKFNLFSEKGIWQIDFKSNKKSIFKQNLSENEYKEFEWGIYAPQEKIEASISCIEDCGDNGLRIYRSERIIYKLDQKSDYKIGFNYNYRSLLFSEMYNDKSLIGRPIIIFDGNRFFVPLKEGIATFKSKFREDIKILKLNIWTSENAKIYINGSEMREFRLTKGWNDLSIDIDESSSVLSFAVKCGSGSKYCANMYDASFISTAHHGESYLIACVISLFLIYVFGKALSLSIILHTKK